jgi:hypothetical protein
MKRALLTCILLVIFTVSPRYAGAAPAAVPPLQADKAAGAPRKGALIDLKSVEPLKEAFQRDSGKIRLVALISPT